VREPGHHVEEAAPRYDWEVFRTAFNDCMVAGVPAAIASLETLLGFKVGPEHLEPCKGLPIGSPLRGAIRR
jgi:hypothetical protein